MNESKIAVRYAKALFLASMENKILEEVKNDMFLISEVIKENEPFRNFLYSPVTKPSALRKILKIAFGDGKVSSTTFNFLEILIQNNRIKYLSETSLVFFTVYRKEKGIKTASLLTVSELDENFKAKFQQVLKSIYKSDINLTVQRDPGIIGGFVLTVDDQQYDASVSSRLNKMKKSLLSENLN